jgi:hypothetical protein
MTIPEENQDITSAIIEDVNHAKSWLRADMIEAVKGPQPPISPSNEDSNNL